ncbi:hypothetical protein HPB49_005381 [Dermacentor silvarum]|uniref:Uncharacterized protein n=1 Tax=Dermacentor silvarum TaxID=543639 RepID=A0ACB8DVM6_DERSI|nr:hypothetical protein HPB49_005381 [Dermacentor silvarum]
MGKRGKMRTGGALTDAAAANHSFGGPRFRSGAFICLPPARTDLDIDGMMEKSKKTIHRLEMKLFRLKKALQTLQDGYDEARGRLRALKCEQLSNITAEVMKLTEEAGFRIVTDNHQTNVSLFKSLSDDGTLSHVVTHPVRIGDPLFLYFDQNHLIKNFRNNFLERELLDGDQLIKGGVYMKKLFEIQSQLLVKPVRFLIRAHVEPNNLEKQKVRRPKQIFSEVFIAPLKFLQENPKCHPDAAEFQGCLATIFFMEMVAKWYAIHDIGGLKLRGQQEEPFYATDDERLLWLEVDFINYIEDLQLSGSRSKQKITKETYEATLLTTRSTVAVGILHAAKTCNAPSSSESNAVVSLPIQDNDAPSCPVEIKHAARELSGELECVNYWSQAQDELKIAPIA